MADRFFRNTGSGWWSDPANWAETDIGPTGFSVPTSVDDAYFDELSGSCAIATTANCRNLYFRGVGGQLGDSYYSGTINGQAYLLRVYGTEVVFSPTTTITGDNTSFILQLLASCTVYLNGANILNLKPYKASGVFSIINSSDMGEVEGTIKFSTSSGVTTYTINIGVNGTYTNPGAAANPGTIVNILGGVTATFKRPYASGMVKYVGATGSKVYLDYDGVTATVNFNPAANTSFDSLVLKSNLINNVTFTFGSAFTINNFEIEPPTVATFKQIKFTDNLNWTFTGTVKIRGSAAYKHIITNTSGAMTRYSWSKASGIVDCDYVNLYHCVAASSGDAKFYAGANSSGSDNSLGPTNPAGWYFTAAPTANNGNALMFGAMF